MAINPLYVFDDFDPLTGESPESHQLACDHIIHRSRTILSQRTKEDIYAINELNRYILSEFHSAIDDLLLEIEANERGGPKAKHTTESEALLKCVEKYELDSDEINNLKWSDMFAVQALSFVSLVCTEEREHNELPENIRNNTNRQYENLYSAGMWALDAMESLGYAEMFNALEQKEHEINTNIEKVVVEKISLKNKKAGIARHSKSTALKKEFIQYYQSREFPSMSNAADMFLNQLNDEKRKILAPTNAKRTLIGALSLHLKSKHHHK